MAVAGTAVVEMVVAVGSTVAVAASKVVAIAAVVDNRSEVVGSWAVVAVDIADMGLVVLASCTPFQSDTIYPRFIVYML